MKEQLSERQLMIKQIPYRLHLNDKILLKKLLRDEGISFQILIDACIQSFMRGDPVMQRFVKDWKELNLIPKEHKEKYTLSHRERMKLLDEIEQPVTSKAGP